MNCKEIKHLLSAYVDGELTEDLKDAVKKHVDECTSCKALLMEQVKLHEQLLSISETPPLPDIESSIMSTIMNSGNNRKTRTWLRPVLVAVPVVLILAILLPILLPNLALSPEKVLARASQAILNVQSYRAIDNAYLYDPTTKTPYTQMWHSEFEVAGDRWDWKGGPVVDTAGYPFEQIGIGEQVYVRGDHSIISPEEVRAITPSPKITQEKLDMLVKIEVLPEENIDGVVCFHYLGTVDIEKFIKQLDTNKEFQASRKTLYETLYGNYSEEGFKKFNDMLDQAWRTTRKVTSELWIGKDDYIIRQLKEVNTNVTGGVGGDITETVKYYDFNIPVVIEAPLDESGALLPGWAAITGDNPSSSTGN